jgi:streptogramin lyase
MHRNGHRGLRARSAITGLVAVVAALAPVVSAAPAQALPAVGGELVIIDSVTFGSQLATNACGVSIALPVTIVATFITPPDDEVTGPYAVAGWSGGFGSSDMHFGTPQAHSNVQVFHIVLAASSLSYHGPGEYSGWVEVQDVGLAGGFAERDNIDINILTDNPYQAPESMKCPLAQKTADAQDLVVAAVTAYATGLKEQFLSGCEICETAKTVAETMVDYSEILERELSAVAVDDPPDSDYQQIPDPIPPPILPPPSGLSSAQDTAITTLESALASNIADAQGMDESVDRVWGAGNADSAYWYHAQMVALAGFAAKSSTDLETLPGDYAVLQASFAGQIPSFPVTADDVSSFFASLLNGLPSDLAATMTELGVSSSDQQAISVDMLNGDASAPIAADGAPDLFAPPQDYASLASTFATLATWAATTRDEKAPQITGLSATSGPAYGGTDLTVTGANLTYVTGISFGPSTTNSGLGLNVSCTDTDCVVTVPPGTGTVDVTAAGPGGPSAHTAADKFTYVADTAAPAVTGIFPSTGSIAGGTNVAVFGSDLEDATISFGPTVAQEWTCSDTECTATAPQSESADTVDITAYDSEGTSALSEADQFTYQTSPPPPPVPVVTGVSPASGVIDGGDQVTITGSGFTNATAVDFGDSSTASFVVLNDSQIQATTPEGSAGAVDVTVVTGGGTSAVTGADQFTYVAAVPVITGVSPDSGPTTGGTQITVTGENLNAGSVSVGPNELVNATCTPTQCTGTTPPSTAGVLDVQVTNDSGSSASVAADQFTYVTAPAPTITSIEPDSGSTAGATQIAIFGTNLAGASVQIGGQNAYATCSDASCSATVPPGAVGTAAVVATRLDGISSASASFTYDQQGLPSITSVEPAAGWLKGYDAVEIIGSNLEDGQVYFGSGQAEGAYDVDVPCTQDQCDVIPPFGLQTGTVHVAVQTPVGTSLPTPADQYTFELPTITSVSPSTGYTIGGTPVTITGTNLADVDDVLFGLYEGSDPVCTDTSCTVMTPNASTAGPVPVTVDVDNGAADSVPTSADVFTYKLLPDPVVTSVSPDSGTDDGGDQVVVTGKYLDGGTVQFGANGSSGSCTDTSCTVITPSSSTDGPVSVTVTTSAGTSAANAAATFTYEKPGVPAVTAVTPSSGYSVGGTPVTVSGTNLTNGEVEFNGTQASDVSCLATTCSAVSPAGSAGTVDVQVVTDGGTSATSSADQFTYLTPPAPTVTGISPATGPSSGGAFVTVTGTDLAGGVVSFGGVAAGDSACGDTSCTATQPAGAAGTIDVTVTTPGGTSPTSAADQLVVSPISVAEVAIPGLSSGDEAGGGQVFAAADGTTWFTMPSLDQVAKIASDGTMTVYDTPDSGSSPDGITQTSDGTAWYTEQNQNKIISIAPGGQQTGYQVPGQPDDLRDLIVGPDGRLWFTLANSGAIGAMTTSGQVSIYPVPNIYGYPLNLVTGPDGRIWFTEGQGDAIGAITTSGHVTEYPVPGNGVAPWGLTVGPDGRLWAAEMTGGDLVAMTTAGVVTQYPLPATDGSPIGVTTGPDGRIWFTETGIDQISALDPATGAVTDYPLPGGYAGIGPKYLAMATDGSIWVSEIGSDTMIHVTSTTTGVAPAVTSVSPAFGPVAGGTQVTITGANLTGATAVKFGTASATDVTVVDAAQVTATAPAGSGTVDVTVTTPNGTTAASPADMYNFGSVPPAPPAVTGISPATGSTAGGDPVTVSGADLSGGSVSFGGTLAASSSCTATSCTATTPPDSPGTVDTQVTTGFGTSAASAADQFTFQAPAPPAPTVTGVSPASGPMVGGNSITVTGTNLTGGVVTVGLNAAASSCTATSCTAAVPPGAGPVDVQVTTAGGTSPASTSDRYSYTTDVPNPPDRPTATPGNAAATVSWHAPASDGGSPITGYVVIPDETGNPEAPIFVGNVLSAKVTGLTNGVGVTFSVEAINANGTSAPSMQSVYVTPVLPVAMTITSIPSSVTYGSTVKVTGKVTVLNSRTPLDEVEVTIQYRKHGTSAYQPTGDLVYSDNSGNVSFQLKAAYSLDVRLIALGGGEYGTATSAAKTVSCLVQVTAKLSAASVRSGGSATISGTVKPASKGALAYLERQSGKNWIKLASQRLGMHGSYKFVIHATTKGTWSYRILVPASSSFAASYSPVEKLEVT